MKVAIASCDNVVSNHFGYAQGFNIYEIEGEKIINNFFIENPGHKPGFLPKYLKEKGIDVIITGGMGTSAINLFNQYEIKTITGASGDINEVINKYLNSSLTSTNSPCNSHIH